MSYTSELALALLLIIPLIAAGLIYVFRKSPNIREAVTLIAGAALLINVINLVIVVAGGARPELHLGTFAGRFEVKFVLEPLGATFAAIASSLWIVNSLYSIGYMRGNKEKHQSRFYGFVAIAIASAMGIAAAGNLITLFIFYEALTLSTFPLVTHKGDKKALKGGTIYGMILLFFCFSLPLVLARRLLCRPIRGYQMLWSRRRLSLRCFTLWPLLKPVCSPCSK